MLHTWLLTLGLSVALQPQAQAQQPELPDAIEGEDISELLQKWPDQYVRWIITDAEKSVYEALTTDEERLKFIEFFWARRDFNPETVDNEYRAEYLERYAFVANYMSAGKPGWATDRGRIYLILGPPHSRETNPFGRWGGERPSEVWTYNNLDIPGFPASIDFEFVDFNGTGDFELVQDIDTAAPIWNQFGTVNNALDALAQRRAVRGEIDPRTGRDRFDNVDNTILVSREFDLQRNLVQVFETPARELPELSTVVDTRASFGNISVTAVGGAVHADDDPTARVPVNVTVPYQQMGSREEDGKLFYELDYVVVASKEDGEEVSRVSDELTVTFDASVREALLKQRLSIQETLSVPPGSYEVLAYVRDRRRNRLGSTKFPLVVSAAEPEILSLSTVFLARDLVRSDLAEPRPFQFGSIRVIPAVEPVFSSEDSLKLYVEAYGVAEGDDGLKRLRVDFFVMRNGRLYMGVPAAHLRPDADPVGITSEIPLRKCTPGAYVIRVRVTDETTGARSESETEFLVLAAGA
jgi:GWxTD domain-containing protein